MLKIRLFFLLPFFYKVLFGQSPNRNVEYLLSLGSFHNATNPTNYVNPYRPLVLGVSIEKNGHGFGLEIDYYAYNVLTPFFAGGVKYDYVFQKRKHHLLFIPILSKICRFSAYNTFSSFHETSYKNTMADSYASAIESFFISSGIGYKYKINRGIGTFVTFTAGYCLTRYSPRFVNSYQHLSFDNANNFVINLQFGIEFKLNKTHVGDIDHCSFPMVK